MRTPSPPSPPPTAPLRPGSPSAPPPPASSNPRPSRPLLFRAVSPCKNHTARPAGIQCEAFHALLLVPFELNRALFFIHFKLIGRRSFERNRTKIAGVSGAGCIQQ